MRLLIHQKMIPASWPAGKYWTAGNHWVDIHNMENSGTATEGDASFYYTTELDNTYNGVEVGEPMETTHRKFTLPSMPVAHAEAKVICEDLGGELPTLETLRLMVEQDLFPESWPKDKYYYTDNGYMVDISTLEGDNLILKSDDGDQPCYFCCEFKKESYDPVTHGAFGPPKYLTDFAYAQADCAAQGGALPSLEDMLSLIDQGRIPDSWLEGYYWATASPNTLIRVHSKTGEYRYSETGKEECFYSCHKAGEADGLEDWKPDKGLYLKPEGGTVTFADAQAACQAQGGELPNVEEMQLIIQQFKEGTQPNTWPKGDGVYYWTKEGKAVDRTDYDHVITPGESAKYYFSCKKTGMYNGIQTGYEIELEDRIYTFSRGGANYEDAVNGCLWQGGKLPDLEEFRLLVEQGNIPDTWPADAKYWTVEKYMVSVNSIDDQVSQSSDGSEECFYSCVIQKAEKKTSGYFGSPLLEESYADVNEACAAQGGVLPSLEDLMILIRDRRIPRSWPTNRRYWAGSSTKTPFSVDIKTGEYDYYSKEVSKQCYYSCKKADEPDGVQEWVGVEGLYMFPQDAADYAAAVAACVTPGGGLATVSELRTLIRQDKIPPSWPKGYYWASGSYYMNIEDGTFSHSIEGTDPGYAVCSVIGGQNGVAQGDEVKIGEKAYMSPQGPVDRSTAERLCALYPGKLPTHGEMRSVIDQGIPDTWPKDRHYWVEELYDDDWMDITSSNGSITGTSHEGDKYYYTCKIIEGFEYEGYYYAPPVKFNDYASAEEDCIAQGGILPSVRNLKALIEANVIPGSWKPNVLWADGGAKVELDEGFVYLIDFDGKNYYCIKIPLEQ